jgi:uncharacterized protein YndB with AHSA1/START domain
MYGTLEQTADAARLRFARHLAHPPEKVWRALTEPERLKTWFPYPVTVDEWVPGAELHFGHGPRGSFEGEVLAVEPERLLEFSWGTDVIRFELEPDGDGTLLVLVDTLETVGKAARDGAGWHVCLDQLEHHLAGTEAGTGMTEQWKQVHGTYVDRFGPEAATIGPPEGALD